MTDSDSIPEDDMPQDHGANFNRMQKAAGAEAYKILRSSEKLYKHDKIVSQIHGVIIAFGQKLQVGRDLYEGDNNGFNAWIERCHLNFGRMGGSQQERTACMTIARLHEDGVDPELVPDAVPCKLDLTHCRRARPTDIIKWARDEQPHLFDDLRDKIGARKPKGKKKPANKDEDEEFREDEEIGDLGNGAGNDPLIDDLRAEIARLRAEIASLKAEIGSLRQRLGEEL